MSLKNEILACKDQRLEPFEVPEWNATVYLRNLNGHERQRIFVKHKEIEGTARYYDVTALVVVLGLGDESGQRIFEDKDITTILNKDGAVLERVASAIQKHNGLHKEAVDDEKKDSETIPTSNSK